MCSALEIDHDCGILIAHTDTVISLCMVSAGVLASGSYDKTTRLWDLNADTTRVLSGHGSSVSLLSMMSKSEVANISLDDNQFWLEDLQTGTTRTITQCSTGSHGWCRQGDTCRHQGDINDWVECSCVVSTGVLASAYFDKTIRVWDVQADATRIFPQSLSGSVLCMCMVSADVLASGYSSSGVRLLDVRTGASRVLTGHSSCVSSLCTVTVNMLASGSQDKTIRLWDLKADKSRVLIGHTTVVLSLCLVSAIVLASGSEDGTIRLWDVRTAATTRTLMGHGMEVVCLCMVSADVLASGGTRDGTIRLWQTSSCCRGDSFTSQLLVPPGPDCRKTFDEAAWGVVITCVTRNNLKYKSYTHSGWLGVPKHLLGLIESFVHGRRMRELILPSMTCDAIRLE